MLTSSALLGGDCGNECLRGERQYSPRALKTKEDDHLYSVRSSLSISLGLYEAEDAAGE
ncbi:unnamed protein product, partial [Leuciscus chuanchicus]